MKHVVTLILMLLPFMGIASNQIKNWSNGSLTWNDFQGTTVISGVPSYMKVILEAKPQHIVKKGKTRLSMAATAQMDCDRSFADADMRTEQQLRYHQLQFDMLEVYRRRLQKDLNTGMTGIDADNSIKYYQGQYDAKMDAMALQTKKGSDDHKLQEWEYYVRKQLEEESMPTVPEIVPNSFSYGFYFGTGAIFPTGAIDNSFSGSWTFTAGLGVGYDRFQLKSDITYGQPSIQNRNIFEIPNQLATSTYSSYLAVSVSLGFSVLETKYFTITPHIGGYWSSYGWNVGNYVLDVNDEWKIKNSESLEMSNFNWYASIDFDYHFHTIVGKSPFFLTGQREKYTSSIRISPFIGRAIYKKAVPQMNGCQIGFTIAYVGIARSLGIK